jgi:hypothetical protein
MKTVRLTFAVILSIFLCVTARAGLKWEQTAVELHPGSTEKTAVAHFKYQNSGDKPVHFASVKGSCSCTVAQPPKNDVAPGEKGEIAATFTIGDRTGTQVKTVTVQTDDPVNPMQVLTLTTIIPQGLEVSPAFVFWQSGEDPKFKSVTAKAAKDFFVKQIRASSSNPKFQTRVVPLGKGEFRIDVQPLDTSSALSGTIVIEPDNSPNKFYASARVMPPALTASPSPGGPPAHP